jgi:hypothetical protein
MSIATKVESEVVCHLCRKKHQLAKVKYIAWDRVFYVPDENDDTGHREYRGFASECLADYICPPCFQWFSQEDFDLEGYRSLNRYHRFFKDGLYYPEYEKIWSLFEVDPSTRRILQVIRNNHQEPKIGDVLPEHFLDCAKDKEEIARISACQALGISPDD